MKVFLNTIYVVIITDTDSLTFWW